ncbi:hypothetical protein [Acidihalobacter ferrooxydans]|uniref:hypothetical protein n=1 Tax=Acidihalobacter ferrooxydans TaxID=1765967 RepID=UPI001E5FD8E4|nr:hypothetical protein [Acidihalobacter ferrooxydans]
MKNLLQALGRLWREPLGRWTVVLSLLILFPLYAATLPASLTGGSIGWVSMRLLTPGQALFAFALALLLALTLGTMVLLLQAGQKASKGTAAGGALVAFFAPLLCCSPLIPLGLGALAVAFPAVAGFAPGIIQGFIATHELEIELFALGLSLLAFWQNARKLVQGPVCGIPCADVEHGGTPDGR